MKKGLIGFWLFVPLLLACSTSHLSTKERLEKNSLIAQQVKNQVDSLDFDAEVTYMYPSRGLGRALDYGWNVRIKNDSVYSYLPYYGRAYQLPYGGGKGLNFSCPVQSYKIHQNGDGKIKVVFNVRNEEDRYVYTFYIYNNGSFDLNVFANQREQINFTGKLNLDRK